MIINELILFIFQLMDMPLGTEDYSNAKGLYDFQIRREGGGHDLVKRSIDTMINSDPINRNHGIN